MSDAAIEAEGATASSGGMVSPAYRNYALGLLVLIYTVNFLDRQIINTIGEAIKRDMHLSDTQLGMMGGIYFALFYTVLGIPIARMADRGNRPLIMVVCLTIWSGFTVLSGVAKNFWMLAISRMGVGIGEAGCSPTAHSLLSDYFPKEKRATALAIYSMGISLGTLLGMAIGGLVAERYGWRPAFFVAGAPGLILAAVSLFTLKEPRKTMLAADLAERASAQMPLKQVLKILSKKPTFWLFAFGGALVSFVSYAHAQFFLSFFLRNYPVEAAQAAAQFGMSPPEGQPAYGFVSLGMGLAAGIGGAFGSWLGGYVADKLGSKNIRNYALLPIIAPFITLPTIWYLLSTSNITLALILLIIPNIGVGAWWGPVYGGVQGLVPPIMRAMSAAILLFVINIIGLGLGPPAVGAVADMMANRDLLASGLSVEACKQAAGAAMATCAAAQAHGLKLAMYFSTAIIPLATLCFFASRWTIAKDMES